mmetsp:Transcript_56577/g.124063  ORF Transcript_56577/g.124063 Transcript_56577/m.124063 type:complete len:226 (+) Transcript_56577:838-1515(+)
MKSLLLAELGKRQDQIESPCGHGVRLGLLGLLPRFLAFPPQRRPPFGRVLQFPTPGMHHDADSVPDQIPLHLIVDTAVHRERRRAIDLQKPRLKLIIYQNVKPEQFKTAIVLGDGVRQAEKSHVDDVDGLTPEKAVVPPGSHKIILQLIEGPFATSADGILRHFKRLAVSIDRTVGQVGKFVIESAQIILLGAESYQTVLVDVGLQRVGVRDEHVHPHIPLITAD